MKLRMTMGCMILAGCGCQSMNHTEKGLVAGGAMGGLVGTAIGAATGRPGLGAAIGVGGGALAGGLIGGAHDRKERNEIAQAQAIENSRRAVSLHDVITMTQNHVGDENIIRQIETTGSLYDLNSQDVIFLRQQGVSSQVIQVMQSRRPGVVRRIPARRVREVIYVEQPPPAVHVGFGVGHYHRRPHCRGW